ncbi:MAG: hypothetical protein V4629_06190 [Pseudomonadota bacterium]
MNPTPISSNQDDNKKNKLFMINASAILWPSFLLAVAATGFFFSIFDPIELGPITAWNIPIDRQTGYSIGFFLFWLLGAASSSFTFWLLKMPHVSIDKHS